MKARILLCVNNHCHRILCTGIAAKTPAGEIKVHAICILASMDLPARAIVTNTKQFNGEHGCLYCEHPGVPRPNNHRVRCWPHIECSARTHDGIMECAKDAVLSGNPVRLLLYCHQ